MSDTPDREKAAPDVFDAEIVAAVASEHDIDRGRLGEHLAALQDLAERHDGVDGLVYEWRTAFHEDPLLARTGDAYELVVRTDVWRDFADRLDLEPDALRAVMAVHARQVGRGASEREEGVGLGDPIVLARE